MDAGQAPDQTIEDQLIPRWWLGNPDGDFESPEAKKLRAKKTRQLRQLQPKVVEARTALAYIQRITRATEKDAIAQMTELLGIEELDLGSHECPTSPIQTCVYDAREDPAHDDCLFCEDPSERK